MRNMLVTIFNGVRAPRKDRPLHVLTRQFARCCLPDLSVKAGGLCRHDSFAKHQARDFGRFPYTDKNPTVDTFKRLFAVLNTEFLEQAVLEQGKRITYVLNEKQIAIDGKKQENQGALLDEIKDVIKYHEPFSTHSQTEKEHARVETHSTSAFHAGLMEDKEVLQRWRNLKTIVKVETNIVHVPDGGKETSHTRDFICDEDFPWAAYFGSLAGALGCGERSALASGCHLQGRWLPGTKEEHGSEHIVTKEAGAT